MRRRALAPLAALALMGALGMAATASAASPIRHVFIIVLETAMISGQAPNTQTQADCPLFTDFPASAMDSNGQELGTGCVYPADVPTVAGQLTGKSHTVRFHSSKTRVDHVVFSIRLRHRAHHVTLAVVRGTVAIEGYGVTP